MANLLDTIRRNNPAFGTSQPQMEDETGKIQKLLRAKSGRSVAGSPEATSSLAEQQVGVQNAQEMSAVGQEASIAAQGLGQQQSQIQQRESIARGEISQARRGEDLQSRLQTENILNELERDKGRVDLSRESARLEQVGQSLRLDNQEYVDNLQREGDRARLDNSIDFNTMLQKTIFGEQEGLLQTQMNQKDMLDFNDAEFARKLAHMDASQAWKMYQASVDQERREAQQKAWGSVLTMGIGAAGSGGGGGGGMGGAGGAK